LTSSYFFSGVVTGFLVGEVAGFGLVSSFLSTFLSSLAGLDVGLAVDEGLGVVATGVVATTGEAAGVGVVGLFWAAGSQPARNAAIAAITVSRNDLLIVFLVYRSQKRSFKRPAIFLRPPPRLFVTQPDAAIAQTHSIKSQYSGEFEPFTATLRPIERRKNKNLQEILEFFGPYSADMHETVCRSAQKIIIYSDFDGWNGTCTVITSKSL